MVLLAGCGGGAGTGATGGQQSSTAQVGNSTVTYFGKPKPLNTVSSGSVTVATMAGATISSLRYDPPPTLANTYITYSRLSNSTEEIFKVPATGGPEQLITHLSTGAVGPAASTLGTIFFMSGSFSSMESMVSDGSKVANVPISTPSVFNPSVSPTGLQVAYDDGSSNLQLVAAGGGTSTAIQHNDYGAGSSWFPNGKSIAYCALNGSSISNVYSTSTSGGTATDLVPTAFQNEGNFTFPSVSSDGLSVAAAVSGSGNQQIVIFSQTGLFLQIPQVSGGLDAHPSFSPDGSEVAFYRQKAGGANPGIYVTNYAGTSVNQIVPDGPNDGQVTGLSWSPFPVQETLIGGTHFYGTASGFLLGMNGSQFGSLTAFTTTTPSTAAATTSATNGSQPLIYTISGDQITEIGYTNYYFSSGAIVTPPASTPSALVTIDSGTGQVDMVATAAVPASRAFTKTRTASGNLTYTGRFTGLYDGKGKNLAPSGARQVTIDSNGRLVAFR